MGREPEGMSSRANAPASASAEPAQSQAGWSGRVGGEETGDSGASLGACPQ
jgi:hypothetical protein